MLSIVLVMAVILVVSVLVLTYAAFPHRGHDLPAAPWLGQAMAKAADAVPTIEGEDDATSARLDVGQRDHAQR